MAGDTTGNTTNTLDKRELEKGAISPMRILCLIATMGPGGAERALSRLVTDLATRHDVTVMTWEGPDDKSFYQLPLTVIKIQADLLGRSPMDRLKRIAARPGAIRAQIKKSDPDVVLSFMDTMNITAVYACLGLSVPVVVAERTDPRKHTIARSKSMLRQLAYGKANRVIFQTKRVSEYFPTRIRSRSDVIPNPIPAAKLYAKPELPDKNLRYRIICLGRLGPEKGFDRLIKAFKKISTSHPNWDVIIFGEGVEREALEKLIQDTGLSGRVFLPGLTTDPETELAKSHIMAFPSHYEGFPNALAEGLAVGLPAVGYQDVNGVEELIIDGKTGFLAKAQEPVSTLASALSRLISDDELRRELGDNARRHTESWDPKVIFSAWEKVLTAAARNNGSKWEKT